MSRPRRSKIEGSDVHPGQQGLWTKDDSGIRPEYRHRLLIDRGEVEKYVLKGQGGIYWTDGDAKGENPLMPALKGTKAFPKYFAPWMERIREFQNEHLDSVVTQVPLEYMTIDAKQFCLKLIWLTVEKLKEVAL